MPLPTSPGGSACLVARKAPGCPQRHPRLAPGRFATSPALTGPGKRQRRPSGPGAARTGTAQEAQPSPLYRARPDRIGFPRVRRLVKRLSARDFLPGSLVLVIIKPLACGRQIFRTSRKAVPAPRVMRDILHRILLSAVAVGSSLPLPSVAGSRAREERSPRGISRDAEASQEKPRAYGREPGINPCPRPSSPCSAASAACAWLRETSGKG